MDKNESRIYNSLKNFIFGFGNQIVISLLTFVARMVFIRQLGMEYLGINGLFSSILTVLSLAELGFGNIVVYSLYKPIAEQNHQEITSLIKFYKNIYLKIAAVIGAGGLMIVPILSKIVKTEQPVDNLTVYYLLFLANTVVSYLFVYKTSLIRADQKQYIISKYTMLVQIIITFTQIVSLYVLHDYIVYLILQILCTFLINYFLSVKADKIYPYIIEQGEKVSENSKAKIFDDVKAMFSYRIGGIILNSTDNIFISTMVNTMSVGIYSNYTLVISFINQFINMIYDSLYSSVGNLNSKEDKNKQKEIFNVLVLCFSWIASVCFVCIYVLINPFIITFFGLNSTFETFTVLAICINFYLPVILYPIWMYRNTTGLFKETKNILLYTAALNCILSFLLGRIFGITGILSATFIARGLTSFWFEPYILYKKGFDSNCKEYFINQIEYICIILVAIIIIEFCTKQIASSGLLALILKALMSIIIVNSLLLFRMHKKEEFIYLKKLVLKKKGKG